MSEKVDIAPALWDMHINRQLLDRCLSIAKDTFFFQNLLTESKRKHLEEDILGFPLPITTSKSLQSRLAVWVDRIQIHLGANDPDTLDQIISDKNASYLVKEYGISDEICEVGASIILAFAILGTLVGSHRKSPTAYFISAP